MPLSYIIYAVTHAVNVTECDFPQRMHGDIPPLTPYTFMAWCSV